MVWDDNTRKEASNIKDEDTDVPLYTRK